jgi:hypothetical protein
MPIATGIAFAAFWYRGAKAENISPPLWVGPSLAISAIVAFVFMRGWIAVTFGQVLMFVANTMYRTMADGKRQSSRVCIGS